MSTIEIAPSLVKALREKTGAGMMDCKKALVENKGDLESASDWLRKKGLSAASKKSGRIAAEGVILVENHTPSYAVMLEVNAETDFVARNPSFQNFVKTVSKILYNSDYTIDTLLSAPYPGENHTVHEILSNLIATIGENIQIRRFKRYSVQNGCVATYVHGVITPGLGKIGVVVVLESEANSSVLIDLGRKIAMHCAAASPIALRIEDVDQRLLEREISILTEQAEASGRSKDVISKMVEGRIRKFYEEVVLLEQISMVDGKTKISTLITEASKELGHSIAITEFARFALGEGIEKEEKDFAAEVMAQIKPI